MDFEKTMQFILDMQAKHEAGIAQLRELVTGVAEGTARLLRVAEMHQQRLDSHDNRLDNLEGER